MKNGLEPLKVRIPPGPPLIRRIRRSGRRLTPGGIIAIETEFEQLARIGESVDDAYRDAVEKYPGKQFYFRRVGEEKAAGYLFTIDGV